MPAHTDRSRMKSQQRVPKPDFPHFLQQLHQNRTELRMSHEGWFHNLVYLLEIKESLLDYIMNS